ncbi:uncharacterized protein B0H18DRAFT_1127125 [Fomitopsis serialis]|uniref:uncharacterized protein n=1 Tax=Fomitopsis serialis TaxID=139415 RepID=UPI0020088A91|nr:uncharacterized protein B0H18DRAFT_1127125 [Neoantrodia serialis]KAH9912493.1 hypothetical protein B0H18DRAFT_1127125 [Neoantrodia serialis]
MPSYDKRVFQLFYSHLPRNGRIIAYTKICPVCPRVKHITVLCLEKPCFAVFFDYCPKSPSTECPATPSTGLIQLPRPARQRLWDAVMALENPPKLEGWLFPGAVKEMYDVYAVPEMFTGYGKKEFRLVEALVFVEDRHRPMSLPLMAEVVDNTLKLMFRQPITAQVFPALPWYREYPDSPVAVPALDFHYYNLAIKSWDYALGNEWFGAPETITLPLPLSHIPVFKRGDVTVAEYAEDYSLGRKRMVPLCAMTNTFSPHLEFERPVGLRYLQSYVEAEWVFGLDAERNFVATCPSILDEADTILALDDYVVVKKDSESGL